MFCSIFSIFFCFKHYCTDPCLHWKILLFGPFNMPIIIGTAQQYTSCSGKTHKPSCILAHISDFEHEKVNYEGCAPIFRIEPALHVAKTSTKRTKNFYPVWVHDIAYPPTPYLMMPRHQSAAEIEDGGHQTETCTPFQKTLKVSEALKMLNRGTQGRKIRINLHWRCLASTTCLIFSRWRSWTRSKTKK